MQKQIDIIFTINLKMSSKVCSNCYVDTGDVSHKIAQSLKVLHCKHRLCATCLTNKIRIIPTDKLMIVKCPVDDCHKVTVKDLPQKYCRSPRRKGMSETTKKTCKTMPIRTISSPHKETSSQSNDIYLSEFTEEELNGAIDSWDYSYGINWKPLTSFIIAQLNRVVNISYCVVVTALLYGYIFGFDVGFSYELNGFLSNQLGKAIYPLLLLVLLLLEHLHIHYTSKLMHILDGSLVLTTTLATLPGIDYGYCHSIDRYLVMSVYSHYIPLFLLSIVVVEVLSVMPDLISSTHTGAMRIINSITKQQKDTGIPVVVEVKEPEKYMRCSPSIYTKRRQCIEQNTQQLEDDLVDKIHSTTTNNNNISSVFSTPTKRSPYSIATAVQFGGGEISRISDVWSGLKLRKGGNFGTSSYSRSSIVRNYTSMTTPLPLYQAVSPQRLQLGYMEDGLHDSSSESESEGEGAQRSSRDALDTTPVLYYTSSSSGRGDRVDMEDIVHGSGSSQQGCAKEEVHSSQHGSAKEEVRSSGIPVRTPPSSTEKPGHSARADGAVWGHTSVVIATASAVVVNSSSQPSAVMESGIPVPAHSYTTVRERRGSDASLSSVSMHSASSTPVSALPAIVHSTATGTTPQHGEVGHQQHKRCILCSTTGAAHSSPNNNSSLTTIVSSGQKRSTPTKSTYGNNPLHTTPTKGKYGNNPLSAPSTPAQLHRTPATATTGATAAFGYSDVFESPEEEFKLRSNIKLKPLGTFTVGPGRRSVKLCEISDADATTPVEGYTNAYMMNTSTTPASPPAKATYSNKTKSLYENKTNKGTKEGLKKGHKVAALRSVFLGKGNNKDIIR